MQASEVIDFRQMLKYSLRYKMRNSLSITIQPKRTQLVDSKIYFNMGKPPQIELFKEF